MQAYTIAAETEEQIPVALRGIPAWGVWSETTTPGGKPSKVPQFNTTRKPTWRTWEQVKATPRWSGGGVGFITTGGYTVRDARMLLLDIDSCRNPKTGEVVDEVCEWIAACDYSYTEVSPSGFGLRVIVCVRDIDVADVRATCRGTWQPTNPNKAPGIQVFGLGPAGYVTLTGERLDVTSQTISTVQSLNAMFAKWGMLGARTSKTASLDNVVGEGEPPTLDAITAHVSTQPYGPELVAGDWNAVPKANSASEGFHALVRLALDGANGHGQAAVDWLLTRTAWGSGQVDDSKDPSKYTRAEWVAKDVARAAAKAPPPASLVFDELPMPERTPEVQKEIAALVAARNGNALRIVDEWERDGPLVHLPTGIESLDDMTGGGLVLGSRVYMLGAPNAGKTALAVQIADTYMAKGIDCALLGVDEEPSDLAMRMMQRRGFTREQVEHRVPAVIAAARAAFGSLPLLLFDGSTTIEAAAVALHKRACERHPGVDRPPCVLFIDSVQTARCEGEDIEGSLYVSVTKRVAAIRACASRYRMLVVATSEMNRAAYKSKKAEDQVTDMAAGKESGAIEFSARVLLALRSVPGSSDVVELRVAKNKHGADHRVDQDGIFLRVNRAAQTLAEAPGFEPVDADSVADAKDAAERNRDAAVVAALLFARDMTVNVLLAAAVERGVPKGRTRAARDVLLASGAIVERDGDRRSKVNVLVPEKLPRAVAETFAELISNSPTAADQSETT